LKKSITNIASDCRIANIVRNHAMILADDATPKPDGIFGKDRVSRPLKISQPLTAQNCYLDMAAMRPDTAGVNALFTKKPRGMGQAGLSNREWGGETQ
jgi:hypothetical protein